MFFGKFELGEKMAYAIDLFCGAGGMSEGLLQAGFKILFASDINAVAMQTYINRTAVS